MSTLLAACLALLSQFLLIQSVVAQDVDLITDLIGNEDKELRAIAFDQIRKEAKGEEATKKFAELLPKFPPETQVGLLSALADRKDAAAAPAIRELLASSKDESVRIAAVKALGPLGNQDDLKVLVPALASEKEELKEAARASLISLPANVSSPMVDEMKQAAGAVRVELIKILTTRRAREAIPALLASVSVEDAAVRTAALNALAVLGDAEQVADLAALALKSSAGKERDAVEKTIAAICLRNKDPEERAAPVLAAIQSAKEADQNVLLSTVGRVGGPTALKTVDEALASKKAETHEAAVRAFANWPDGTVVSRLLSLARTDESDKLRKTAFQALVRIAPLDDDRADKLRLDTLRTVFAMCSSDAERKQVLDRAKAIRSLESFRFAVSFLGDATLKQQACLTIVELAHHTSLREANKEEFHKVLDQVIATSSDEVVIDRAKRYKAGQTWYRPKAGAEE